MASKLTVAAIENLPPGTIRREVPDGKISGLYLVLQPSGAKSWALRYRSAGKPSKHTIGSYPAISLARARELAQQAAGAIAEGRDPHSEKVEARRAVALASRADRDTVDKVAESFVERYAKPNTRETSWRETKRILDKEVVPCWRGRRIQDISRRDVIELLDGITDRGKTIMANRVLAAMRRMFSWCVERGMIEASPCASVKAPAAERSRDRVLADDELRTVWAACEDLGIFGPLVRLLILTGQRRDEVANMRWTEVDLSAKTWTLPRERSKNDAEHTIPLSEAAVGVLKGLPRIAGKGYVFTSTGEGAVSGFSRAKERLDKRLPGVERWTFHDLRRTAASGMARLGQPVHVVEAVLNHRSGTIRGVARVYNRYSYEPEKRGALDAWSRYVKQLVSREPAGNVVELAAARCRS
jgi:integrase